MNNEKTLVIIKPDAVKKNFSGKILSMFEEKGIKISGMKMLNLTPQQAEEFYQEHKERSFFSEIVNFMTSGPIVVLCLSGQEVVKKNRELIGSTDPEKANPGTIRNKYGENIEKNAIHGSDSLKSAEREISFFFKKNEIF